MLIENRTESPAWTKATVPVAEVVTAGTSLVPFMVVEKSSDVAGVFVGPVAADDPPQATASATPAAANVLLTHFSIVLPSFLGKSSGRDLELRLLSYAQHSPHVGIAPTHTTP